MACAACAWCGSAANPCCSRSFFDIIAAVHAHGVFVFEINTNGRFLTAQVLARISSFGFKPEMKISFDGLGFHDWMRGCGAPSKMPCAPSSYAWTWVFPRACR